MACSGTAGKVLVALVALSAVPATGRAQPAPPAAASTSATLADVQAGCQKDCRLEVGETQRVAGDELTVVGRQPAGGALEVSLHSKRAGLIPAASAPAHVATLLARGGPIEDAKGAARVLLALRLMAPSARIVTTPEELPRLAAVARRRVRQDSWPRTDPRPQGRFLVTAVVHRQVSGLHRVDRLLMVMDPAGQWLAASEVLHCDRGFSGGCALVGLP